MNVEAAVVHAPVQRVWSTLREAVRGSKQDLTEVPSGVTLRLILDETNLGAEASVGEMIFPANLDSGEHTHGAIEMFYVVSGTRGERQEPVLEAKDGRLCQPARPCEAQDGRGRSKGSRHLGAG